jgi:tetratricopeptide (TPR) repeat protein
VSRSPGAESGEGEAQQDEQHVDLLLELGEVQARAWNTTSAQQTFEHAAELARGLRHDHPAQAGKWLARAALGFGRTGIGVPRGHVADPVLVPLLEDALEALGETQPALRARALARLAVELYFSDSAARRAAMCEEAARLARLSDDPSTQAYVVMAQHFASWDSPDVDWRLSIANEGVDLARRAGEPDLELVSRLWRILDLLEKGEVQGWETELDEMEHLAAAMRQPRHIAFGATLRAMRALWLGRFGEAERHWKAGLAAAERVQDRAQTINVAVQNFFLQRARGLQAEQMAGVEAAVQALRGEPTVRCMRAILHGDLGHREEARQDFERLAEADFATLQRNNQLGSASLPWLAEVCAYLGDTPRAAVLHSFLLPLARQNIVGGPRIFFGPAAHWLGLLAATLGHLDEAIGHFELAIERSRAMDGAPAVAATRLELARALLARDDAGDRDKARDLVALVRTAASDLDLVDLAHRAQRLAEDLDHAPERERRRATAEGGRAAGGCSGDAAKATRTPASSARVLRFPDRSRTAAETAPVPAAGNKPEYVFRREGEFWTVSDGSTVLRLKDTKGLRYIAQLLQHPDREFHVMDLVAPERAGGEDSASGLGQVSEKQLNRLGMHTTNDTKTGERLLDAQARAAYQRRLEDLRDELDEATRFNDLERAARAREEMDFLARELARAVGLGGRARASASGAERARLNVTRAIKAVLRRITAGSANLGRYLETTIRTGAFCSYRPDPRLKVSWKL